MRRRTLLHIALALFLVLAASSIYLIVQKNNPTPTPETPPAQNNTQGTHKEKEKTVTPTPPPKVPITDWAWAIEKYKGKEIIKVATDKKIVTFTFDAGANADGVDKVLPILAANGITGTFFLTGKFIEKYPDKVKAILSSGGDLGNHTYDHPYLTHLDGEQIKTEIQKAEDALAKLDAKFLPFLRSPYGDRNASSMLTISESGYLNIRWTIDSLGWKGTSGGLSKVLVENKVLKNAAPGAIIMMHLGSNPDDKTHLDSEALPDIIAKLKADGYTFVTLAELITTQK